VIERTGPRATLRLHATTYNHNIRPPNDHPTGPHPCASILLYLAHAKLAKKKTGAKRKHSRYRKDFFRSLSIEERRRRYRKIPRCALIALNLSLHPPTSHSHHVISPSSSGRGHLAHHIRNRCCRPSRLRFFNIGIRGKCTGST